MRRITSFLAAFLSLMTFTCASEVSLSDVERAMMTLVDQVRGEQVIRLSLQGRNRKNCD